MNNQNTIESEPAIVESTAMAEVGYQEMSADNISTDEIKKVLEAALMAASEPLSLNDMRKLFDGEISVDTLRILLDEMRDGWQQRSVELTVVASGYRFRVKPEFQKYLDKLSNDRPPKYSRAVMETLAIIAYRQPVTRGDIEDIRGVAVSPYILKTLEERGWIDEIGHKEVVGRPALFATTKHFLDDLNLRSLDELPPLHELQATLDLTQAGAALSTPSAQEVLPLAVDVADNNNTQNEHMQNENSSNPAPINEFEREHLTIEGES